MEFLVKAYNFLITNKENVLVVIVSIGAILESINAIFPTENKNSFLEKIGKLLSELTKRLPSNVKKDSNKIEDKK